MTVTINTKRVPVTSYKEEPESVTVTMTVDQARLFAELGYYYLCGNTYFDSLSKPFVDVRTALSTFGIDVSDYNYKSITERYHNKSISI